MYIHIDREGACRVLLNHRDRKGLYQGMYIHILYGNVCTGLDRRILGFRGPANGSPFGECWGECLDSFTMETLILGFFLDLNHKRGASYNYTEAR